MPKIHAVNVRTLAEFMLLKGDLMPANMLLARMNEGSLGHRQLQSMLSPEWNAEEAVIREELVDGVCLKVQGRADAVLREDGIVRVLEIKTTQNHPAAIGIDRYPAHLAQAVLYAYLLCENEKIDRAEVQLCYYRLDGAENRHHRRYSRTELRAEFLRYARPYAAWISALDAWKERSLPTLREMAFPFEEMREGQLEMSDEVYGALSHGTNALIEAPTGIGKTAASLYGALKALGEQRVTAIFYLTARTTGRHAAENALKRLRTQGVLIRSVTITAKEKICRLGKPDCPGCPYAADYYTRRRDALKEGLDIMNADFERIRVLGEKYALCPYELTLDLSEQADVIICDYNYVFDPRVHLRRWFDRKNKVGLLIDEAHNLPNRACDMLSAELSGKRVFAVYKSIVAREGKDSPAAHALMELIYALRLPEEAGPEALSTPPTEVLRAATAFADCVEELHTGEKELTELMLEASWFGRCGAAFDPGSTRTLILPEEKTVCVRLWCFDPSRKIARVLSRTGGAALFSATLTPPDHYARLMGLDMRRADTLLMLPSPFPPENQLTLRIPVSVKYADRTRTLGAVAQILHTMVHAHTGNYLACFPSFAYLALALQEYRIRYPHDVVVAQYAHMSDKARTQFIEAFLPNPRQSMLAFIVLGGVFAEGVDLPDDRLSGAAIISTGMPQIGFVRALTQELFDDGFGAGQDAAYTFPGIRRVLQAAGRVIRTPTDRGVVLLLDTRYAEERIGELLPGHWAVRKVTKISALRESLQVFWSHED